MTDEFKKARDETCLDWLLSGDVPLELHTAFDKGADWAYEWLVENMEVMQKFYNADEELVKSRQELEALTKEAEALAEALEFYEKDGGMVFSEYFDGPGWQPKNAREALTRWRKFRGE